tara:strand:+ start:70 stop:378 length:309 start_codon:yes stop_codon:yes gene_type:complete
MSCYEDNEDNYEFDDDERIVFDDELEKYIKGKDISCEKYWNRIKQDFLVDIIIDKYEKYREQAIIDFIEEEYDYHDCMENYISRGDFLTEDMVNAYNENYPN